MGLAPFFDRARLGAAQVLRDFDAAEFERRLNGIIVTLAFDAAAAGSPEGRAALDMTARLASRLYPRVRVTALGGSGATTALARDMMDLMRRINPHIDLTDGPGREIVVAAGDTSVGSADAIYMGSDRWLARVSTAGPVGCGASTNPFGAGAAACIAMANVFRAVFAARLERPGLDADLRLSLLGFDTGAGAINGGIPAGCDLGAVRLVGVGAIGNAFVWGMSRLRGLKGELHLIDHEPVELSNLQRYVLTGMVDVGSSKVALAAAALSESGLRVRAHEVTWRDHAAATPDHRFDMVAVALDTARDRVQVAGSLPRRVRNAWTQAGDLGVSRHGFGGDAACLACLYLPTGRRRNEDEIVLEELGLPPERLMDLRSMLHIGLPVGDAFVREVAMRRGVEAEVLLPFAGLPLRSFRQKAICGNAIMAAPDGRGADLEVPMAFQSALAGVMLAAEIVASVPDLRAADPDTCTVIDLMREIPARITFPMRSRTTGVARCICRDPDYVEAYRAKYSVI